MAWFPIKDKIKNKWNSQNIAKHCKNQRHKRFSKCYYRWHCAEHIDSLRLHQRDSWMDRDIFLDDEWDYFDTCDSSDEMFKDVDRWECHQCTFINTEHTLCCHICGTSFDFNYRNNAQCLHHCDDVISITEERPSTRTRKRRARKKKIDSKNTKESNHDLYQSNKDAHYWIEAEKYRLRKLKHKTMKLQSKKKKTKDSFRSFDVELSIIATEFNHYEFVEEKMLYNKTDLWINVPMKLVNIKLLQCSLKIIDVKHQTHIKTFHVAPSNRSVFVPVYITKYPFIYKHRSIPKILQNRKLFKLVKYCLCRCMFDLHDANFNYNITTTTFDVSSQLFPYIPAMDVLYNVLCLYIGYKNALQIKINVNKVKIDKDILDEQSHHQIYNMESTVSSCIRSVVYKYTQHKPKLQTAESESESGTSILPFFVKYLNADSDYETDSDSSYSYVHHNNYKTVQLSETKPAAIDHVLFKTPYKYRHGYDLCDDDPDRDKNWWKDVTYSKITRHKYKRNDRLSVSKYGSLRLANVVAVGCNWIRVKYDDYRWEYGQNDKFWLQYLHGTKISLINTRVKKHKKQCSARRKQKAYSKTNNIRYSKYVFK